MPKVGETMLKAWFCREVLPLEPLLSRYIGHYCHMQSDIADIRQDVYERVLAAAADGLPSFPRAYVFAVARNVLINRARRAKIVSMELVADFEDVIVEADWLTPARHAEANEELQRFHEGLERLPPRCREVLRLRKIEGLTTRETATALGVGIDAIEQQTALGMRAIADYLSGGKGVIRRPKRVRRFMGRKIP